MASVSPFPTSQCWYHFIRVQISRHSSVQSSSTFGSRKARKPIYIPRFKKIEQGQLLYPKIFPPIFLKTLQEKSPSGSRLLKNWTVKSSPKAVNLQIRVLCCIKFLASKLPQVLPNVLICSQVHPCQISSLAEEVWSVNCSRGPKIDCARAKVNCVPNTVKPQDFLSTFSFWRLIHHLIKGWSWFIKDCSRFIKIQKLLN